MTVVSFPDRSQPIDVPVRAAALRAALRAGANLPRPIALSATDAEGAALMTSAVHRRSAPDGSTECIGDGVRVLQVVRSGGMKAAFVLEPGRANLFGTQFVYAEHFLPEQVSPH